MDKEKELLKDGEGLLNKIDNGQDNLQGNLDDFELQEKLKEWDEDEIGLVDDDDSLDEDTQPDELMSEEEIEKLND